MGFGRISATIVTMAVIGMVLGSSLNKMLGQIPNRSIEDLAIATCNAGRAEVCPMKAENVQITSSGSFYAETQIFINATCVAQSDFQVDNTHVLAKLGFSELFSENLSIPHSGKKGVTSVIDLGFLLTVDMLDGRYKVTIRQFDDKGIEIQCNIASFFLRTTASARS